MSADAEIPIHHVTLNADQVVVPLHLATLRIREILSVCLPALDVADLDNVQLPAGWPADVRLQHSFDQPSRRTHYADWLGTNAFRDLAKALRHSLEGAFLYIGLAEAGRNGPMDLIDFHRLKASISRRANSLKFPPLIAEVSQRLTSPLQWVDQMESVNRARNVIEHRAGLVGKADCNSAGLFEITLPRIKLFAKLGDEEIELRPPMHFDQEVQIMMRVEPRVRTLRQGEMLTFTPDEAFHLLHACQLFAADLASKLPRA